MGDVIKIGTTTNLKRRLVFLLPDEILAIEPGDRELERKRHKQFIHLRVRGERFRPGQDLLDHIAAVVEANGPPVVPPPDDVVF
jgi:hypothetical protein